MDRGISVLRFIDKSCDALRDQCYQSIEEVRKALKKLALENIPNQQSTRKVATPAYAAIAIEQMRRKLTKPKPTRHRRDTPRRGLQIPDAVLTAAFQLLPGGFHKIDPSTIATLCYLLQHREEARVLLSDIAKEIDYAENTILRRIYLLRRMITQLCIEGDPIIGFAIYLNQLKKNSGQENPEY